MKKTCLTAATALLATVKVNTTLVTQSGVQMRLERLIGLVNTRFLRKNFGTVSTLQHAGGVIAVTGCRPHHCAANGSLVAYDAAHDAFKVGLTMNGKTRVLADKAFAGALDKDVKACVSNCN